MILLGPIRPAKPVARELAAAKRRVKKMTRPISGRCRTVSIARGSSKESTQWRRSERAIAVTP